jgi:hypothetical protein
MGPGHNEQAFQEGIDITARHSRCRLPANGFFRKVRFVFHSAPHGMPPLASSVRPKDHAGKKEKTRLPSLALLK